MYQYVADAEMYMNMDKIFRNEGNQTLAPHFFGCLAQTEEGSSYISEMKEIAQLHAFLENAQSLEITDANIVKIKAAIWTFAYIGSSATGFQVLKSLSTKSHILDTIVALAANSPVISIRGTCLYSLCLFCKSSEGQERLESLNWTSKGGISFPMDSRGMFDVIENQLMLDWRVGVSGIMASA